MIEKLKLVFNEDGKSIPVTKIAKIEGPYKIKDDGIYKTNKLFDLILV